MRQGIEHRMRKITFTLTNMEITEPHTQGEKENPTDNADISDANEYVSLHWHMTKDDSQ